MGKTGENLKKLTYFQNFGPSCCLGQREKNGGGEGGGLKVFGPLRMLNFCTPSPKIPDLFPPLLPQLIS